VSQSLRLDTYKLFGINREIEVIPNFIHLGKTDMRGQEDLRSEYAEADERILVHISNFRPVKRIHEVVEIFAGIRKQVKSKLVMVGDGPERSRAEQFCREHHLCDEVVFLGNVKNPMEILSIADLFILPSESESFGLSALEAMALGVPVISTNTGGLPEVNRHGVTGMMSNVGDVEDMIKNSVYLLSDMTRLERFRQKALDRAKEFSMERILPMYEQVYNQVLQPV
jgi:N-acetyl-alpha-D-glucosaminyl L-malate synthase BshA